MTMHTHANSNSHRVTDSVVGEYLDFDPIAYINEPRWMESRFGLDRIIELLERLGNPQDNLRSVHVAGTNGKGSTSAFIAQIMQEAGYKTGLFTSPYIVEFSDRIQVNKTNITFEELRAVTLDVKRAADAMSDHPTEFELMTAVAFLYFSRQACDIVVCEVGMGGRFDSTNVITAPEVSVITSIGLDHTSFLGDTLASIATEKAGIIKTGVPVVSWPQKPEVTEVIDAIASDHNAPLTVVDFHTLTVYPFGGLKGLGQVSRVFDFQNYQNLTIQLMGSYQPYNAALAIEVIEVLRKKEWIIPDAALYQGLAKTKWPGRFELVDDKPLFIIDGGHNPEGVRALKTSLHEVFPGVKPVFIIGFLEDKDYDEMLDEIVPLGEDFVIIEPPNPRALSAEKLARAIRLAGHDASISPDIYIAENIPDAIKCAKKLAGEDGLVCACGSLYSVADLKKALDLR